MCWQVDVIDVNEPPTGFLLVAGGHVPENSPRGTYNIIGDVVAIDQDANQTHTFQVIGAAPGIVWVAVANWCWSTLCIKNYISLFFCQFYLVLICSASDLRQISSFIWLVYGGSLVDW